MMKKCLFRVKKKRVNFKRLIALQGASLVAMDEYGKPLDDKALGYFENIMNDCANIKRETVRGYLNEFPELARAKTRRGTALIAHIVTINNPHLLYELLEHGADLDATTRKGVKARGMMLHKSMKNAVTKFEKGQERARQEAERKAEADSRAQQRQEAELKAQQKSKSFLGKHMIPQNAIIAFLLAALGKYAYDNYFRKPNKSAEAA